MLLLLCDLQAAIGSVALDTARSTGASDEVITLAMHVCITFLASKGVTLFTASTGLIKKSTEYFIYNKALSYPLHYGNYRFLNG
jgi:hypothetical protein